MAGKAAIDVEHKPGLNLGGSRSSCRITVTRNNGLEKDPSTRLDGTFGDLDHVQESISKERDIKGSKDAITLEDTLPPNGQKVKPLPKHNPGKMKVNPTSGVLSWMPHGSFSKYNVLPVHCISMRPQ
jgi:hypothetical protein